MGFMIDYLREKFPLNRVVIGVTAVVTPFAAGVGGSVATWLAQNFPLAAEQLGGKTGIVAIFITGAVATGTAIITLVYKWLEGWQKDEARKHAAATLLVAPPTQRKDDDPAAPLLDAPSDDMARALADKPEQAHRTQGRGASPVDEGEEFSPKGG